MIPTAGRMAASSAGLEARIRRRRACNGLWGCAGIQPSLARSRGLPYWHQSGCAAAGTSAVSRSAASHRETCLCGQGRLQ
jgi:hypothetical protein